jgi:hypothetical protein
MRKSQAFKIIFSIFVAAGVVAYLNAYIVWNSISSAYETTAAETMEDLTIEGTSFFLQSNSDALLLLNEVEVGYGNGKEFDFAYALALTGSAISRLETARGRYMEIMNQARESGYVKRITRGLRSFDYGRLARTHRLNGEIMGAVGNYLRRGNIRGLYAKNIGNIDSILQQLYQVREMLNEGKQPSLDMFWALLHGYSDAMLLGNYATMVFANI